MSRNIAASTFSNDPTFWMSATLSSYIVRMLDFAVRMASAFAAMREARMTVVPKRSPSSSMAPRDVRPVHERRPLAVHAVRDADAVFCRAVADFALHDAPQAV